MEYCCILNTYRCMHNHNDDIILLENIPLTLLKGLCVLKGAGDRTELQYIDPHSYGHQRCVFLVLEGCSTGSPGAQLSAECWLSLPQLDSNFWSPKLTDFPSSPSYIIVQSPTQYLWNGMFDRHQAEITVMQFTGHSLPVHQSMTVPWDFNPVPYCQPDSPTPMEYALPPSLEWHVWPSRRSIYNSMSCNHRRKILYFLKNLKQYSL